MDTRYQYPIGHGYTAEVFRGICNRIHPGTRQPFNTDVAVKKLVHTVEEQQEILQQIKREVAVWRHLHHPNVTQFLGIACIRPGEAPCLVSPFLQRNDLLAYIGRHSDQKRGKAQEIARGVQYMHSLGIVHGDLKVDNVLLSDEGVAQVNDFGMSRMLDVDGFTTMVVRDVRFNAPELMPINGEFASDIPPTFKSDVFSLAILFLQLFHGPDADLQRGLPYNHVPLHSGPDLRLLRCIYKGERPQRGGYGPMSDKHWELLCQCWQGDPSARPDIVQVVDAL
jgi:serine/threonine protein kinase